MTLVLACVRLGFPQYNYNALKLCFGGTVQIIVLIRNQFKSRKTIPSVLFMRYTHETKSLVHLTILNMRDIYVRE